MTKNQLKDHLKVTDLDFAYKGVSYFICPVNVFAPFSAGQALKTENKYETFDDLLNNFMVQDKPLKDILSDIDC